MKDETVKQQSAKESPEEKDISLDELKAVFGGQDGGGDSGSGGTSGGSGKQPGT